MKHYIKSIFTAVFFSAIFIWGSYAHSACQLNLPTGTATMTVDAHEYEACSQLPTFTGYFDAALSGIPSGYSLGNGTYSGFCADLGGYILDNPMFGNVTYQVQLLSSVDNPTFRSRPWDKINYILTHYPIPQNSWLDVQAAVWTLIDGCAPQSDPTLFDCQPHRAAPNYFPLGGTSGPYGCPPNGIVDKNKVLQIVADANANGVGFMPVNGSRFAIIIDPQSCTGSNSSYNSYCSDPNHSPFQLLFTTATCVATYTITASAGANGGISPPGAVPVTHGSDQSFTISPDANYHVADVLVDGSSVGAVTGYTFNSVTADHTISASFAINTNTITSSAGTGGSISPGGAVSVNYGANQPFTISPNANYHVADVLVDGSSVGAVTGYTFNGVTASHTITASFAATSPLTITTSSLPAGQVLTPYSQTLTATGGVLPYSWSVSGGALPDGVTVNSSTGDISGSPTTAGTFNFTAQVTDATSSTAVKNLSIATAALPVRYGDPGAPINVDTIIQSAYDHCADGYIIEVQAMEFPSDVSCDRNVLVTLRGGFDAGFNSNPSYTTITGMLRISNGTVVIENIIVK